MWWQLDIFSEIFDPEKNGQQLTEDSVTRLKNEFAANDPNVFFSYVPFSDDDTERPAEVCFTRNVLFTKHGRERQGDRHCRHATHPETV